MQTCVRQDFSGYHGKYNSSDGDGNGTKWLTGKKAIPFITLHKRMSDHFGAMHKADSYIGIGQATSFRIREEKRLTNIIAKRILNAYNVLKAQQKVL